MIPAFSENWIWHLTVGSTHTTVLPKFWGIGNRTSRLHQGNQSGEHLFQLPIEPEVRLADMPQALASLSSEDQSAGRTQQMT